MSNRVISFSWANGRQAIKMYVDRQEMNMKEWSKVPLCTGSHFILIRLAQSSFCSCSSSKSGYCCLATWYCKFWQWNGPSRFSIQAAVCAKMHNKCFLFLQDVKASQVKILTFSITYTDFVVQHCHMWEAIISKCVILTLHSITVP
jgi:hypothetical protein